MPPHEPFPERSELPQVLELVMAEARSYLDGVDQRPLRTASADASARSFRAPLPDVGNGASAALRELIDRGLDATVASSGPRFFHFVIGGATPAALGADWLASTLDQLSSTWVTSPLAVELELVSLGWLRELFGLPAEGGGVMVTGAQMANFTGLAAARQWCGERAGIDVSDEGLPAMPPIPVFSSGYVHASTTKAVAMLGLGRRSVVTFARDAVGRLDVEALEAALRRLDGAPAIVVANAGEVNAGDFDPIDRMADLAERHGAWLHVDGAFGLFAAVSPRTAHLCAGVERADSVTVDGHKWLNVPYDCGFSFVRDPRLLAKAFALRADYLPEPDEEFPTLSSFCPESSRRARSLSVWATLRAYGREGCRRMVEAHLDLTQRLAEGVDAAPDLERLAEAPLNIVCFRYVPTEGATPEELDRINTRLGDEILRDGRVYLGTTRYAGRVALRPAIVNWRTREADIDLMVDVVRELGARCARPTPAG